MQRCLNDLPRRVRPGLFVALALAVACLVEAPRAAAQPAGTPVGVASPLTAETQLFHEAAAIAWRYVEQQHQPATGLINSVINYPYTTVWDIASAIAALYCARRLDLIDADAYDRRMRTLLATLNRMELFRGVAFNKNYRTRTGAMAGRNDREDGPASKGYGWSVTDIGRLLVWLRIVAVGDPHMKADVERIVARIDLARLVRNGYLSGEDLDPRNDTTRVYQEGRAGYEQYAAKGFAMWGMRAEHALDITANTEPVTVMGVPLLADRRPDAHLTSEPFLLLGLELGWDESVRGVAWRVLEAQRRRYEATTKITIASEDALPIAPHFFYYSLLEAGVEFPIRAMASNENLDSPRWVSAKGAYAWHALLPSEYTRRAVAAVAPARTIHGWASGVFEHNGRSTGGENLNTAAVILEAALYAKTGRPILGNANE